MKLHTCVDFHLHRTPWVLKDHEKMCPFVINSLCSLISFLHKESLSRIIIMAKPLLVSHYSPSLEALVSIYSCIINGPFNTYNMHKLYLKLSH